MSLNNLTVRAFSRYLQGEGFPPHWYIISTTGLPDGVKAIEMRHESYDECLKLFCLQMKLRGYHGSLGVDGAKPNSPSKGSSSVSTGSEPKNDPKVVDASQNGSTPSLGAFKADTRPNLSGKLVEVVRGRKVPIGTRGKVFWDGMSKYGRRLGINTPDGATHWTAYKNVKVV